jgi:hypothetical protein
LGIFYLFSLFGFEHHHISYFCDMLKHFWIFCILSCPSSFVWALFIIEEFSVYLLHLPPRIGCDPSYGYFSQEKPIVLKRRLWKVYFSLVKGLSNMVFSHFKRMHLGLVSLNFIWICKMVSQYSLS